MTTITAVQLRKDLDTIIKRAAKGERIRVTYRGTTVVTIGPDTQKPHTNSAEILRKARELSDKVPPLIKANYQTDEVFEKLILNERMRKYGGK